MGVNQVLHWCVNASGNFIQASSAPFNTCCTRCWYSLIIILQFCGRNLILENRKNSPYFKQQIENKYALFLGLLVSLGVTSKYHSYQGFQKHLLSLKSQVKISRNCYSCDSQGSCTFQRSIRIQIIPHSILAQKLGNVVSELNIGKLISCTWNGAWPKNRASI